MADTTDILIESPHRTGEAQRVLVCDDLLGSKILNANPTILIACEYSGIVRDAFASKGWDAWSCDLLPSERHGKHFQGDALIRMLHAPFTHDRWDMIIAHPPCTYLSSSGMHWTTRGLRDPKLTEDALDFVRKIMAAPCERICVENPVGIISTRIRKPDQIIQPHYYGSDASKQTCLWLKNLPELTPTEFIAPRLVCKCGKQHDYHRTNILTSCDCGEPCEKWKARWANQTDSGQNKLAPSEKRGLDRAKTYTGIAEAMADQWTKYLCQ